MVYATDLKAALALRAASGTAMAKAAVRDHRLSGDGGEAAAPAMTRLISVGIAHRRRGSCCDELGTAAAGEIGRWWCGRRGDAGLSRQ
jgi:hypothetical protein